MAELSFVHTGPASRLQCDAIPMLAVCFDEFVEFQKRFGNRFPFVEESFLALCGQQIVGHAGLMPMRVYGRDGEIISMAGLASVAVHPDFRKQGIAAQLCNMAAAWAEEHQFALLPLYTGLNRVYESCGWRNFAVNSVTLINPDRCGRKGKCGAELTEEEKKYIISSYEGSPVFSGKVIREKDTFFHSWERMFNETFFTWYLDSDGYALEYAGFAAEGSSEKACSSLEKAFLSPEDPLTERLLLSGWRVEKVDDHAPACWGGENVMIRSCKDMTQSENLFFSLADKF